MEPRSPSDHKIEPEYLGPLGDRPMESPPGRTGSADLFPGASKFLSARQQAKRRRQWNAVRPMVRRLLRPEEHILYVAFAMQVPPALHHVGFGHLIYLYHQVVLVITDQRVIEAMLNFQASGPGTRLRSFPYRHARQLKLRFRQLRVEPARGKKQSWRLGIGGDRKVLKLLLPRLESRLLPEGSGQAVSLPVWHCPQCAAEVPVKPSSCSSCGTIFRSSRMAALLSLAFPGAGLLYAGHPGLAAGHFVCEATVFLVWIVVIARAAQGALGLALLIGGIPILATKLASLNVGQILVARSIPEPPGRRERFRKFAPAGALLSALVLAGAFPLAAMARPRLKHDLDAASVDGAWSGSRRAADWGFYKDDKEARSQWTHAATGEQVMVFAFPEALWDGEERFHSDYSTAIRKTSLTPLVDDGQIPPPFRGFRYIGESRTKSGRTIATIAYFLYDTEGRDVHQITIAVPREKEQAGEELVRDFLGHARWIDPVAPSR